ncbi:putative protein containing PCI domain [Paragonimus heterotremus]|uniref:CSN12-like protein n=1 Tax=Paragonimus heterotremus TaxID=100268 RepID=A0A8J4TEP5_9TREM|nr:putative protein containing PCI domain [Paragonimus heterotremus]
MKPVSQVAYLSEVASLINSNNGEMLAKYIICRDPHVYNPRLADPEPESVVMKHLTAPWDEAFSAHMRCIWAMRKQDFEEAYACQVVVVKTVARILTELKEENWVLPVVLATAIDLRRFAHGLDTALSKTSSSTNRNHGRQMETAAQLILRLFQLCASDSRTQLEDSKKLGMMGLANQLFKIYFQINKLNLCKSMIRAIDNLNMNDRFSLAQRVTYCYYVGRKSMFDGNFVAADKSLSFAFERCLGSAWHNKRLILIYLIPVKMLLGVFPYASLLTKYNLNEFLGISEAVKAGNLQQMDSELNKYESFFLSCGVYLILEKLKLITYRNLFKKVCAIMKTHLLPIDVFTAALRLMGVDDIDQDETECILANLIYEGKIKGYLAHQQQKLVVSKLQAFPTLTAPATVTSR